MPNPLSYTRRSHLFATRLLAMPLFLAKVPPRGDNGLPDDKDKEIQNLNNLLKRHDNDANSLARELLGENAAFRKERRELRDENAKLSAKVPGEGTLVLSGDDAKAWQAYREQTGQGAVLIPKAKAEALEGYEKLGAPDTVTKALEDGKAASEANAKRTRAETLEAAAKIGDGTRKFKPAMLKVIARDLDVQIREVDVLDAEGKTTKAQRPFVVSKDEGKEKLTPLAEHVKTEGDDVLEALFDDAASDGNAGQEQNNGGGINFPAQGGGKGTGAMDTSMLDNFGKTRYGHNLPKAAA